MVWLRDNSELNATKMLGWGNSYKFMGDLEFWELRLGIFQKKIGNRRNTLFWLDVWWGDEPLKNKVPEVV